jgi:uncharacterized protein (TIGR01777 family)
MSERIVISGGTGFVGRALAKKLAPGREIVVLTRGGRLPDELAALGSVRAAPWDATSAGAWESAIDGADAVVHLAGEQAVGIRYTESVKRRLYESRVNSAGALVGAIARARRRPRVVVSASGVDYYRGRLSDEPVDETESPGDGFLARLCVAWEDAARAAEPLGVRVCALRLGVVLAQNGPLATMALPFKLFVGGPLGSGRQIFSWVHRDDAVAAFERAVVDGALSGAINLVAPEALPQAEFARRLGRVLHRPSFVPAPSFALRALFGEGADPILFGRRVVPARLEAAGFRFAFPTVDAALADAFRE